MQHDPNHLRVADNAASRTIATILRYDARVTSYKLALIRAINDVVLSFPDAGGGDRPVAVPLRILAEYWIAYYWPFVDPRAPISQGPHATRGGVIRNDMAFRPALMALRIGWEELTGEVARPSDGFFLINEFRVARRRQGYPERLRHAFSEAVGKVDEAIQQPVQFAGPGHWKVFPRPVDYATVALFAAAVPGTTPNDRCVLISTELWDGFLDLSLWVEALSIHEWSLFTESVAQPGGLVVGRGNAYTLLTDRPDNRPPLDWERNQIDLLMMEGHMFTCPWTGGILRNPTDYDLDHLFPVSVYPINELWNLVPANRQFNQRVKRDRAPSRGALLAAAPRLEVAYAHYKSSPLLGAALRQDVAARFTRADETSSPHAIATVVVDFIQRATDARNLARFG